MKKISQGIVMTMPFPTNISVFEQGQIIRCFNDLRTSVSTLTNLQSETTAELDAILDKAFRGEL